jgi:NADH dehydrogenase
MSDATILWFFFGGIALIAGSGSTFGLDYYIVPRIKKWWKNTKFARKSYLYFD